MRGRGRQSFTHHMGLGGSKGTRKEAEERGRKKRLAEE